MEGVSITALAELLKPPGEETEQESELDVRPSPYANPGSIGGAAGKSGVVPPKASKDIWSEGEVPVGQQFDYDDPRPEPEYELVFKQAVTTEDVFLGMSLKNPTTASCEDLVVRIKLPGADFKQVNLDITESFLDCRSPQFRLGLHLPHRVQPDTSKARWLSDKEILEVTLKSNRDYDFINY
eukprot:Em0022g409a